MLRYKGFLILIIIHLCVFKAKGIDTFKERVASLKAINKLYKENRDSLVVQLGLEYLKKYPNQVSDSIYCKVQKKIGDSFQRLKEYQQAQKHLNTALTCFKEIPDSIGMMNTLYKLSLNAFYQAQYNVGLEQCDQLLAIADPCKNIQWVEAMNFKGVIYRNTGSYQKAIKTYQLVLQYIDKSHEHYKMTITNLASALENNGDYLDAISYLNILLKLSLDEQNITGQVLAYNGIGYCYYALGNDTKALEMYHKAFHLAPNAEKQIELSNLRERMGLSYKRLGNIKKAEALFQQNYKEAIQEKDSSSLAYALLQLGEMDHQNGKYTESEIKLFESLQLFERFDIRSGHTFALLELAILYRKKGEDTLYQKYIKAAYQKSKTLDDKILTLTIYNELASIKDKVPFLKMEDYESINNILFEEYSHKNKLTTQLLQMQMKEIQLENLVNQQKQQKLIEDKKDLFTNLIILAVVLILLSMFFIYYIFQNNKTIKLYKLIEDQHQNMKLYYMALSHDLKHPLLSIQSQIKQLETTSQSEEEKNIITKRILSVLHLSQRLIHIFDLESSELHFRKINIIELMDDILDMLDHEYQGIKSMVHVKSETHTFVADTFLMRQLFNNLLINSLQHNSNKENLKILIHHFNENDIQYLEYSDNGKGIQNELIDQIFQPGFTTKNTNNKSVAGLGMFIIKKIIEKHNGLVKIIPNANFNGFKIVLQLPIKA